MNKSALYKLSAASLIVSGLMFLIIRIIHPVDEVSSIGTTSCFVAHLLSFLFPIFGILGIAVLYASIYKELAYIGFAGYIVLVLAFILMINFGFYEAFIAPSLVDLAPSYVQSGLDVISGGVGPKYLDFLFQVNGVLFLDGSLLFAVMIVRLKNDLRYDGFILLAGLVLTLTAAALPVMNRIGASVYSLGLITLGVMLFHVLAIKEKDIE